MKTILALLAIVFFASCKSSESKYQVIFNVPSLMLMDTTELIKTLGPPYQEDILLQSDIEKGLDKSFTWDKKGYEFSVDVSPLTGAILRAFFTIQNDSVDISEEGLDSIRSAGNLDSLTQSWVAQDQPVINKKDITVYTGYWIRTVEDAYKLMKKQEKAADN